jgi:hypothetical protein
VLDGADAAQVAAGLAAARASATAAPTARGRQTPPDELQWPNVAPLMLAALTEGAADWPESRV